MSIRPPFSPPDVGVLRSKIEQITNVTTVPQVVQRVGALLDSQHTSAGEVAEEIGKDQVLAAKVLKLVNSGFCGFRKPITTMTHAMVLLGFDVVRSLVLSASVFDLFSAKASALGGLWQHSLGTARASTLIAERLGAPKPEEYAVAGLLHDIGKVLIAEQFPKEYAQIRSVVAERDCLQFEAEKEVLGVTHADVGMWLLRKWSLPSKLVAPVGHHNNFHPSREFADRSAVVHLADILARAKGIGHPGDDRVPPLDPQAWRLLDLEWSDIDAITRELDVELEDEWQ
ncbi:MAG: HDOD domain-containing protein [Vicinamibacterales bacterium]